MNTLTISEWKTLNLTVGDMLVNSSRKQKKSDIEIMTENICSSDSMCGISLNILILGFKNYPDVKARPAMSTN